MTAQMLAGIWERVLSLDRVGETDDFFALGGHSLMATQVINRVREVFDVEVPLRTLFDTPQLGELAGAVEAAQRQQDSKQRCSRCESTHTLHYIPLYSLGGPPHFHHW